MASLAVFSPILDLALLSHSTSGNHVSHNFHLVLPDIGNVVPR